MAAKKTKSKSIKKTAAREAAKVAERATEAISVGQQLKERRIERGLSLKDIEQATRIRGKYLVAIEAGSYTELPHDIYTKGFIQSYANHVGLDGAVIAQAYTAERGEQELQMRRISSVTTPRFVLTPRRLTLAGGLIVAAIIITYLATQLSTLTAAPNLEVTNPPSDQVLHGSLITVSGHVAGGADVFVNDSPILVDGSGGFTDPIALQDGVNSIRVSAKNRLGKTTTITRNILAHVPKTDPASQLPSAPFDGVAVSVRTEGSAATVTVTIDGKQAFRGTMLPGTAQTFKGSNKIVISTTNAAATNVTVTNTQTANKLLGPLGSQNQPKKDFEFDKETQFQ